MSFDLDGIKKGDRVAVAMSGGVDSSVAACLMKEAGYDVVGITLQLYDHGEFVSKKGACCAGQDIYDARNVADQMGFPHYVLDYESVFKQNVIDDFADSYLKGETPIPCIRCNQKVKFKDLLKTSMDLGAKAMVTGHYVQRKIGENEVSELHSAIDKSRDQSYFLFTTTQEQLDYLRFPLGGIEKSETREIANRFSLNIKDKPDSQDICFVPNGNYASVVSKLRPEACDPGDIIHVDGRILGSHKGIINYTIGQRKGLGISSENPLYVIKLNALKKQVIVGEKNYLAKTEILTKEVNWLYDFKIKESLEKGRKMHVKIRSSQEPIPATVYAYGKDARIVLQNPEYGVASGQACVFYEGSRVIGGGWISNINS